LAERIGRRRDHEPVMLTINTQRTIDQGVFFFQTGETIFTAKEIPPGCFTGPPLPKPKAEIIKIGQRDKEDTRKMSGSFMMKFPDKAKNRNGTPGKREKRKSAGKRTGRK
ncbi:MAG: hypothetical protein MUP22_04450, partial [Desulfobacterales bacterium]|nr:hypothetical protein [Desulfobacterales bacterium]